MEKEKINVLHISIEESNCLKLELSSNLNGVIDALKTIMENNEMFFSVIMTAVSAYFAGKDKDVLDAMVKEIKEQIKMMKQEAEPAKQPNTVYLKIPTNKIKS